MDFNQWLSRVDKLVFNKLNIHLYDLPDESYAIYYEDSIHFRDVANYIITQYLI